MLKQAPGEGRDVGFAFAYDAIDRAAHLRDDADALALMLADASSRLCLVHDSLLVHRKEDKARALFSLNELRVLAPLLHQPRQRLSKLDFLGLRDGVALFCIIQNADECLAANGEWMLADLRALATSSCWRRTIWRRWPRPSRSRDQHGDPRLLRALRRAHANDLRGLAARLPGLRQNHFPRTDPVVIMMVTDGDHCLLGRQTRFPEGMWSCLARFVEPGETIEDAVRREIHEEAGIICDDISYFASQPWPYPSSLMIGCRALTQEIVVDRNELEDARWFSRDEVRRMFDGQHEAGLKPPHPFAIAHHLLAEWLNDENGRP